ncbi:MAG: hypothetical protein ACTSW1_00475 [Candidatus Hodarchaeales archaeon]
MSWKIILGKPDNNYIIGKRWIKKHIPKSDRFSKALHKEKECPGDIYYIGKHYYGDSKKLVDLWVCMETGRIMTKVPNVTQVSRVHPKAKPKPKPQYKKKEPKKVEVVKPKEEVVVAPARAEVEKPKVKAKVPKASKETSVSEVKGIGAAAFDKLSAAGIKTIGDLLKMHSQEIASAIGRKSDAQIKKWQDNAKEMIS